MCNTPHAAACLAEEAVDMPEIWGPYSVTENNCEHFATRCKTGRAYSIQIMEIKEKISNVARAGSSCSLL